MSIRNIPGECAPCPALLLCPSRPLVPLTGAFAAGILAGSAPLLVWILAILATICAAGYLAARRRVVWPAILTLCASAGALYQAAATIVPADDVSRIADGSLVTLEGTVASEPELRSRTVTLVIAVERILVAGRARECSGQVSCALARADGGRLPDYGDRIEARGTLDLPDSARNPGGFDSRASLARRGIFSALYARRPGAWSIRPSWSGFGGTVHRLSSRLRASLQASAARYLSPVEASLLSGILIGTRAELPPAIDDDFQLTGTAHILATAGLHVGMVALLLHTALRGLGFSRRWSAGVVIVALILYALVAGGRPSVVRAVLVTDLFLAGYLLDREADGANSLAAAALAILMSHPGALFDAGFQLSFATVGTILCALPAIQRFAGRLGVAEDHLGPRRPRIGERIRTGLTTLCSLTVAAQIGSAPLVAQYFNVASPSGLLANLLIVPVLFPILGLGLLFWLASALNLPLLPALLAALLHPLLVLVLGAARSCSELPAAAFPVPPPGWIAICGYYCAIGWLAWAARGRPAAVVSVTAAPVHDEATP